MNKNTKAVMDSIRCMNNLYKEISGFIRTLDWVMQNKYKAKIMENRPMGEVIADTDTVLESHGNWLPACFYRKYKVNPYSLFTINIALHQQDEEFAIKEPLFLCSNVKFKQKFNKNHWWGCESWNHYFSLNLHAVNTIYTKKQLYSRANQKKLIEDSGWEIVHFAPVKDVRFIAVPLLELNNEDAIIEKVLKKIRIEE